MLEMFLEKPPPSQSLVNLPVSPVVQRNSTNMTKPKFHLQFTKFQIQSPRSRYYKKKKKKNVSNVLRETYPLTQAQFHLPFQFPLPNSKDPESKKPFLQKEGKKNVSN